jgi:hypothetical protein
MGLLALAQEDKSHPRASAARTLSAGFRRAESCTFSSGCQRAFYVRQFSIAKQAVHFQKIRLGSATRVICLEREEAFPQIVTLSSTSQTILPELDPRSEASFEAVK